MQTACIGGERRHDIGKMRQAMHRLCRMDRCWVVDHRGSVSLLFAVSMLMIVTAVCAGINMAQIATVRAQLQAAVDNAALSGTVAYSKNAAAYNALAIRTALAAFCDAATGLPSSATVTAQAGGQSCGSAAGPIVTAVTDSYVAGTPGVSHANGVSFTGTYLPSAPYHCGFIVTVTVVGSLASIDFGIRSDSNNCSNRDGGQSVPQLRADFFFA